MIYFKYKQEEEKLPECFINKLKTTSLQELVIESQIEIYHLKKEIEAIKKELDFINTCRIMG